MFNRNHTSQWGSWHIRLSNRVSADYNIGRFFSAKYRKRMYTISLNTKYLHIITHFTVFTKYRTDHLFSVKYREVDSAIYRLCLKYSAKYSYCLSAIYSISQNNFVKYRFRCEFRKIQNSAKYSKPSWWSDDRIRFVSF